MFKDLFEEQYHPLSQYDYERYLQTEESRKIVFLDDADLISNKKAWINLAKSIIGSGKYLVFTTTETNQDLEEIVKAELQGKSTYINIQPVYKETRDALVDKVGALYGKSPDDLDDIKLSLDYIAQTQTSFFSFTPNSTLQYIKFLMSDGASEHKGVQTISMVFETNIRTSILERKNDIEANIYLAALEYIADYMYFELRTEEISHTDLDKIIVDYNGKRRTVINSKDFLNTCISANILKNSQHSFQVQFFDNNTYAYFVAKSINREFEKDRMNRDKLNYVMEHICFGINDSIILFLSFIRSNTAIIIEIARKAVDLIKDYPEWDFEKRNIPFLHAAPPISNSLPSEGEKQQAHEKLEHIEHEKHEAIKFKGIFDFSETDVSKTRFVILRSFKYTQLVGRALVDQYGALDSDEIDEIIQTLFSASPRIVYAMLQPYQEHLDEIVQSLLEFVKENLPEMSVSEQRVRELLGQAGTTMALNIFDDISFNTANRSTIVALRGAPATNVTRKILQLMMEENVGNTSEFVSRAVRLRKEIERIPYAQILVARIARKHIMYTGSIDHRQIDVLLSENVLSKKGKPSLLIGKGKNNRD